MATTQQDAAQSAAQIVKRWSSAPNIDDTLSAPDGPGSIYTRLAWCAAHAAAIPKKKASDGVPFAFRGIEDIVRMLKPIMGAAEIGLLPQVIDSHRTEYTTSGGTVMQRSVLRVEFRFYAPDGSSVLVVTEGEAADHSDKASNKAMTAALKYCLIQTFLIPTADGEQDAHLPDGPASSEPPSRDAQWNNPSPGGERVTEKQAGFLLKKARDAGEEFNTHGYEVMNAILNLGKMNPLPHKANYAEAKLHLQREVAKSRMDGMLEQLQRWEPRTQDTEEPF